VTGRLAEVRGHKVVPERVGHFGRVRDAGRVPCEALVPCGGQAVLGAIVHVDHARVLASRQVLPGCADGEIAVIGLSQVRCRQGHAEHVPLFGRVGDTVDVLMPDLVARGGETRRGPVDHVDGALTLCGTDRVVRDADRQVGMGGLPEVEGDQRLTEAIAVCGGAGDPGRI